MLLQILFLKLKSYNISDHCSFCFTDVDEHMGIYIYINTHTHLQVTPATHLPFPFKVYSMLSSQAMHGTNVRNQKSLLVNVRGSSVTALFRRPPLQDTWTHDSLGQHFSLLSGGPLFKFALRSNSLRHSSSDWSILLQYDKPLQTDWSISHYNSSKSVVPAHTRNFNAKLHEQHLQIWLSCYLVLQRLR